MRVEWAVYKRTEGGWIATPDSVNNLKRYCWITADGFGWYKEFGHSPVALGQFKTIKEVVEASRRLG